MARKKVGKMSTESLLLIGGLGLVAVYLLTRTTSTAVNPYATSLINTPQGTLLLPGNQTAQTIQAGGAAASQLINSLNNAGIFG